jgi:hypothetical protein
MRRTIFSVILAALFIVVFSIGSIFAEETTIFSLNKDADYDITVELSQGLISKVTRVRIVGITEINNKSFLIILPQGFAKTENALISLDSIKTILPTNNAAETIVSTSK